MKTALQILMTVVCPSCEFSGTALPYAPVLNVAGSPIRCESCGEEFAITRDVIHEAQHVLLVALGEAEPVTET